VAVTLAGKGFTKTLTVKVAGQAPPLSPTNVKVVEVVGLTTAKEPFVFVGNHVYEEAPPAVNVVLYPAQMLAFNGDTLMVGIGTTVTKSVSEPTQPLASIP
jgi:hypothetical protein